jgi:hypothetical protein
MYSNMREEPTILSVKRVRGTNVFNNFQESRLSSPLLMTLRSSQTSVLTAEVLITYDFALSKEIKLQSTRIAHSILPEALLDNQLALKGRNPILHQLNGAFQRKEKIINVS